MILCICEKVRRFCGNSGKNWLLRGVFPVFSRCCRGIVPNTSVCGTVSAAVGRCFACAGISCVCVRVRACACVLSRLFAICGGVCVALVTLSAFADFARLSAFVRLAWFSSVFVDSSPFRVVSSGWLVSCVPG